MSDAISEAMSEAIMEIINDSIIEFNCNDQSEVVDVLTRHRGSLNKSKENTAKPVK